MDDALDILTGLRAAEKAERLEPLELAIHYIEGQRGWIGDYGAWRKLWLLVGSGLVELVINWRAKRRGMRWKRENVNAVVVIWVRQINGTREAPTPPTALAA